MPVPTPPTPPQPPVVVQPAPQQQQQQQQQQVPVYVPVGGGTAADLMSESTSTNDSRSQSDSSSINSAQQSNIQINNNSNRVEVDGIRIPTTTINLNGYYNNNGYNDDFGVVVGISASLDGKKRANDMLEKRIRLTQLQYERELAGACASIEKDNFVINPDSLIATELSKCSSVIRKRKTVEVHTPAPTSTPVVSTVVEELRRENEELKQQLTLILQKLDDQPKVVPGGF